MAGPDSIKRVYFIGIGGIGMSALARYFLQSGRSVAGYDLTATRLTANLESEGIEITYSDDSGQVPVEFREGNPADTLVVYTPAVPRTSRILEYFTSKGYRVVKRSALLGELVNRKKGVAVAGTHGKTSVSTLIAHLLNQTEGGCDAFLGGISKNYNSNLISGGKSDFVVAEADEYDRSFLQLIPQIALITSMDPDHLDIYGTWQEMKGAFSAFAGQVRDGGTLIVKKGLDIDHTGNKDVELYTYGFDESADFHPLNIVVSGEGLPVFDLVFPGGRFNQLKLGVPGRFNIENAVGAVAAAITCGAGEGEIRSGLQSFSGILRRFEILINAPGCVMIDDYAHHPAELRASIAATREIFPGREITGIFQPHLYSRTRDFAAEFAESLNTLDQIVLLDIYPARELPIPGVTSSVIFTRIDNPAKIMCTRDEITEVIGKMKTDIVLTLGAGNIDAVVEPLRNILLSKKKGGP